VKVVTEETGEVVWRLTGDVVNVETVTDNVNHCIHKTYFIKKLRIIKKANNHFLIPAFA